MLRNERRVLSDRLANLAGRNLDANGRRRLDDAAVRLATQAKLLEALSFRATLERGFALVRTADGGLKRGAGELASGEKLVLQFHDGNRNAVADGVAPHPPPPRRRARLGDPGQGQLF